MALGYWNEHYRSHIYELPSLRQLPSRCEHREPHQSNQVILFLNKSMNFYLEKSQMVRYRITMGKDDGRLIKLFETGYNANIESLIEVIKLFYS